MNNEHSHYYQALFLAHKIKLKINAKIKGQMENNRVI